METGPLNDEALGRSLGVAPAWVRHLAKQGRIPAVHVGLGTYLFDEAAVRAALLIRAGPSPDRPFQPVELVTTKDLRKHGLFVSVLNKMADRGEIPFAVCGKRRLWPADVIAAIRSETLRQRLAFIADVVDQPRPEIAEASFYAARDVRVRRAHGNPTDTPAQLPPEDDDDRL